jgi:hypothetical protein
LFKDTRTPVALIFENLQAGMAVDDLIEQFPITREQIRAVAGVRRPEPGSSGTGALTHVLFGNGVPRGAASVLKRHVVEEARDRGWDRLTNGDLLRAAEAAGVDVLLTTDRNIRHQQNLSKRAIAS